MDEKAAAGQSSAQWTGQMLGSSKYQAKDGSRGRRIYLFGLVSLLLFGVAQFITTRPWVQSWLGSNSSTNTRLELPLTLEDSEQLGESERAARKSRILAALKSELDESRLAQTIDQIKSATELSSPILCAGDAGTVRESLLAGALTLMPDKEKSTEVSETTPSRFLLTIQGVGSRDESLFLQTIADNICVQLSPQPVDLSIKFDSLRDKLLAAAKQNQMLRDSLQETFRNYENRQKQLLTAASETSSAGSNESGSGNWELDNLLEQRKLTTAEFQANAKLEFEGKSETQARLSQRIEYLNQEIDRLQQKRQRLANRNAVEKASFVDGSSYGVQPFELDGELESLRAEVALLVNRMDVANLDHSENIEAITSLAETLAQIQPWLRVGPIREHASDPALPNTALLLATLVCSCIASGIIVSRIPSTAFESFLTDQTGVESALQLPVIGRVSIPESDSQAAHRKPVQARTLRILTRCCEFILVGVIALTLFGLLSPTGSSWFSECAASWKSLFGST